MIKLENNQFKNFNYVQELMYINKEVLNLIRDVFSSDAVAMIV